MEHDWALQLIGKMLTTAALISAPILIANLVVGLVISVVQVVTQVQEMTLTFVPKLVASVAVTLLLGGWMLGTLEHFTLEVLRQSLLGGK
jgi:flagellar biosynthetic protein FliQ